MITVITIVGRAHKRLIKGIRRLSNQRTNREQSDVDYYYLLL